MINVIAVFLWVMPGSALSSLQLELRRGFESLKAAKGAFDGGHAECLELVCSLGNLALQLKALKQVQISETPLSGFPCLQQRLHYKLSLAVDALLAKLAEKMWVLYDKVITVLLNILQCTCIIHIDITFLEGRYIYTVYILSTIYTTP